MFGSWQMLIKRAAVRRLAVWLAAAGLAMALALVGDPEGDALAVIDIWTVLGVFFIPAVIVGVIVAWHYIKSDSVIAEIVFDVITLYVICSQAFVLAGGHWLMASRDIYRSCCVPPPSARELFVTGLIPWCIGLGTLAIVSAPFLRPMLRRRLELDD